MKSALAEVCIGALRWGGGTGLRPQPQFGTMSLPACSFRRKYRVMSLPLGLRPLSENPVLPLIYNYLKKKKIQLKLQKYLNKIENKADIMKGPFRWVIVNMLELGSRERLFQVGIELRMRVRLFG